MDSGMAGSSLWQDEDGAVSADFMVLSAMLIAMALAVIGSVRPGTTGMANGVETSLGDAQVAVLGTLGQSAP